MYITMCIYIYIYIYVYTCIYKHIHAYGQFSLFQIAKNQIERLKSSKQICCLCDRTVLNLKLPGSRPQKQT